MLQAWACSCSLLSLTGTRISLVYLKNKLSLDKWGPDLDSVYAVKASNTGQTVLVGSPC